MDPFEGTPFGETVDRLDFGIDTLSIQIIRLSKVKQSAFFLWFHTVEVEVLNNVPQYQAITFSLGILATLTAVANLSSFQLLLKRLTWPINMHYMMTRHQDMSFFCRYGSTFFLVFLVRSTSCAPKFVKT